MRSESASRPLAGLRVLDVGCGGGLLAEAMSRLGAEVTGIDVVERNIQVVRQHARASNADVHYDLSTIESLASNPRLPRFDVVLAMEVVEHVADLHSFLQGCMRMARPNGLMFVATINRNALAWLITIVGAEYILRWLPKGTHQLRNFVKPRELHAIFEKAGFFVNDVTGVAVNPLDRQMSTTKSSLVNYMTTAVHLA